MAKVAITRCDSYDAGKVFDAVKRSVDLLGGIDAFVKPGMKVLLKPNLLSARAPEDAVDTHPEVVRAVVRLVKGARAVPFIGDSPGGYGKNIDEIFGISGMKKISEEEGIEVDKNLIILDEPIKSLGIYEVAVKLHPEIQAKVKIWIVKNA